MIPNLVSHVKSELNKKIKAILSNSYIINEVLKELEDDVSKNFIKKYAGTFNTDGSILTEGLGVDILSNYPENFSNNKTFVLVGMGNGDETSGSLGVSSSGYTTDSTALVKDKNLVVYYDNENKMPFITTTSFAYIPSVVVPNMAGVLVKRLDSSKKLYLSNLPDEVESGISYGKDTLRINYTVDSSNDEISDPGNSYGFMIEESASLLIVSDNLDDIRALDSIIKAAIILMRNSDNEFEKYNIGKSSYSAPVPLQDYVPGDVKMAFGREILLTYTVDYFLDSVNKQKLSSVVVHEIY